MTNAQQLLRLAQRLAWRHLGFFVKGKGPGRGNHATNAFMADLRRAAEARFGPGLAERRICGSNDYCVDFYFEGEGTIVEVALGLPNPHTEYERDVVKAVLAKDSGGLSGGSSLFPNRGPARNASSRAELRSRSGHGGATESPWRSTS